MRDTVTTLATCAFCFLLGVIAFIDCDEPAPEVIPYQEPLPDPIPRAAYNALSPEVEANRADVNSAHERIEALSWQLSIVISSCPGRVRPPNPPYPVQQQSKATPFVAVAWEEL